MDQINPMLQQFLGSIARYMLAGLSVWAVQHGIFTENDAAKYVEAGALLLVGLGWSLYQKYGSRQKLLVALSTPSVATEAQVEAAIKAAPAAVPTVSTPKNEEPQPSSKF